MLNGNLGQEIQQCAEAVAARRAQEARQHTMHLADQKSQMVMDQYQRSMIEAGLPKETLIACAEKCGIPFLDSSLETESGPSVEATRKRAAGSTLVVGQAAKKKKPEKRKGTKVIEGRKEFSKLSPEAKIDFMEQYESADAGTYLNSDRTWIYRCQKIMRCYRRCHNSNKASFLNLHRNKKGAFEYSKVADTITKECPGCKAGA